jgi:hypothetical protein
MFAFMGYPVKSIMFPKNQAMTWFQDYRNQVIAWLIDNKTRPCPGKYR